MSEPPIPMTVLGGYLGSGKTTLLNEILAAADGVRVAVVVNDFGSVNVDADLVRARSGDTLELSNGCVCCSISDGMATVLRRIRALDPAPDRVVVEVSGVGDPAAVAVWADHPGFRRDEVVVCADVETIQDRATDRWVADTVLRQLAGADRLLLTKRDLVADDRAAEVCCWLAAQSPGTPVETDRAYLVERLLAGAVPRDPAPVSSDGGEGASHAEEHRSWTARSDRPVDLDRVRALLATLPPAVVRAKGVLETTAAPGRRTVVQLVGSRLEVTDDGPWAPGAASQLVLIAAGPQDDDLAPALEAALAGPL